MYRATERARDLSVTCTLLVQITKLLKIIVRMPNAGPPALLTGHGDRLSAGLRVTGHGCRLNDEDIKSYEDIKSFLIKSYEDNKTAQNNTDVFRL